MRRDSIRNRVRIPGDLVTVYGRPPILRTAAERPLAKAEKAMGGP